MPRTDRTHITEVRTTEPLTVAEIADFLAAADRAGIPGDHPVQIHVGGHHVIPRLSARLERDATPPPAEPDVQDTQRMTVPLQVNDRARYRLDNAPGTVEKVVGDMVTWTSDAYDGLQPMSVDAPSRDFTPLDAVAVPFVPHRSAGGTL